MGDESEPVTAPQLVYLNRLELSVGERYGRLTIIMVGRGRNGGLKPHCRCDCGAELDVRATFLKRGIIQSCGCLKRDGARDRMREMAASRALTRTPSKPRTPEYGIWADMNQRCSNPRRINYGRYGGRGVRVCEQWRKGPSGFVAFLAEVGPRPSPEHSIDRIDNSLGYEPGNVRWATRIEQANNKGNNRLVTHLGLTLTVQEWSRRTAIPRTTLRARLDAGWPLDDALRRSP